MSVEKQHFFVVCVCMFYWDSLNSKFFQITMNMGNIRNKKLMLAKKETLVAKRKHAKQCSISKGSSRVTSRKPRF